MKIFVILSGLSVLIFATLMTNTAHAVSPLAGDEFRRMCKSFAAQPYSSAGAPCSAYVHGFVGGAHASGKSSEEQLVKEPAKRSAYVERATRTRLKRPIERYGQYSFVGYCVPADETLVGVVESVVNFLNANEPREEETANKLVLAALIKSYPCPKN